MTGSDGSVKSPFHGDLYFSFLCWGGGRRPEFALLESALISRCEQPLENCHPDPGVCPPSRSDRMPGTFLEARGEDKMFHGDSGWVR